MALVRKKPVEVLAHQWFKNGDHPDDDVVAQSRKGAIVATEGKVVKFFKTSDDEYLQTKCKHCGNTLGVHGWISTLEGGHVVCPSDWIITGVDGEIYSCKDSIFHKTYDILSPIDEPINYG